MVEVILHMVFEVLPSLCVFAGLGTLFARLPWEGPEDDLAPSPTPKREAEALDSFSCLEEEGWVISGLSAQPFLGTLVAYVETPSEEPDMREYLACHPSSVSVSPCVVIEDAPVQPAMAYEETVCLRAVEKEINEEELDSWIAHFSYNNTIPEVGSDESTFFGQLGRYQPFFAGEGNDTVVIA